MSNDNHEIDRLTRALHAQQKHPDFDYSVTMEGNEANHRSREAWEPNPEMAEGFNGNANSDQYRTYQRRQLYWMKERDDAREAEPGQDEQLDRLTEALHRARKHPDYEYQETHDADDSSVADGWVVNPAIEQHHQPYQGIAIEGFGMSMPARDRPSYSHLMREKEQEQAPKRTYRERREAKAERLRGWAEKREEKAEATLKANEVHTRDHAFNTQPGHMPIRAKVIAREDRAYESLRKASKMQRTADSIDHQLDTSIYSDDHDAVERLQERVAGLEAQRDRIKAYNASCRKGERNVDLLDDEQKAEIVSIARVMPESLGKNGAFPSYALSNLSGNIKRNKDRLAELQKDHEQEQTLRPFKGRDNDQEQGREI